MVMEKVTVLGGGSWGATLAGHLARQGHDVLIWEYAPTVAETLRTTRSLKTLPELKLPSNVKITSDITGCTDGRDVILVVVPSHTVRSTFNSLKEMKALRPGMLIISASKGIETESHATMSAVVREIFPQAGDIVILSGPSHAEEVAMGQPVALVAASTSQSARERAREMFSSDHFRIYTGSDPKGVELGGAIKNVFAVGCGVVDGLKMGDNTKAALMTRGLLEMTRLGTALGAKPITFFGLSGLGDLILTCNSKHSRNRQLGEKIGGGKSLEQALKEMTMVAEGVNSTRSTHSLAMEKKVDTPIIREIYKILFENKSPQDSIRDLMTRQVGAEMEGVTL